MYLCLSTLDITFSGDEDGTSVGNCSRDKGAFERVSEVCQSCVVESLQCQDAQLVAALADRSCKEESSNTYVSAKEHMLMPA